MLNLIWSLLLVTGILCGIATGRVEQVATAIVSSAGDAVTFGLGIVGTCAFWCGIIRILEAAGGLAFLQKILRPLIVRLFPSAARDAATQQLILTNITADFLGLGNGATPSGIFAVQGLSKLNGNSEIASRDICMFLVINAAALQLLPTTVIAMRAQAGSLAPEDILVPTWLASLGAMLMGVLVYRLLAGRRT